MLQLLELLISLQSELGDIVYVEIETEGDTFDHEAVSELWRRWRR